MVHLIIATVLHTTLSLVVQLHTLVHPKSIVQDICTAHQNCPQARFSEGSEPSQRCHWQHECAGRIQSSIRNDTTPSL